MESDMRPGVPSRAKEVLESFLRDPDSLQELGDVVRWRLPRTIGIITFDQVRRALLWLCDQGYLKKSDGEQERFWLNRKLENEAWKFVADPEWRSDEREAPGEQRHALLMAPAKAWVDATLIRYLKENPWGEGDHPGLTRSRASIERILMPAVATGDHDMQSARRAVAEAAHAFAEALKTAGDEPLAILYRTLRLTLPELQTVALCLAPELDTDYQTIFGVLNDDMSRRTPTLSLICGLLGDPLTTRTTLAASAGLARWRITEPASPLLPHGDDTVRLDTALVSWLLGSAEALFHDPFVAQSFRMSPWPGGSWVRSGADLTEVERMTGWLSTEQEPSRHSHWLALCGEDSDGWRAILEAAAAEVNVKLARIAPLIPAVGAGEWDEALARMVRAVLLLGAVPVLDVGASRLDGENETQRFAAVVSAVTSANRRGIVIASELDRISAILGRQSSEVRHRRQPNQGALASAYIASMSEAGLYLSESDAAQTAAAFPLSVSGIHNAVRLAAMSVGSSDTFRSQAAALMAACRKVASPDLPRFARRVEPSFSLDDIVLPPDRLSQLREIITQVKLAGHVLNNWGFGGQLPYGRGVAALFSGPSGTGKTMAAQAIARELGTEAFVIDLSRVVSKYIGETEKFIDATFNDAQRAGAVLQIDEAEALFGRRSEVKDSHDRYANLEVAYLLQRMEAFDGVAILTTNLRQNVDQAFLRRLRFAIDFPKPDANAREKIWRQCLPRDAPVRDINFRFLARRLELTGGHIRQITLRAAFAAAGEGSKSIEMRHVVNATRSELVKLGMTTSEHELAGWEAAHVA